MSSFIWRRVIILSCLLLKIGGLNYFDTELFSFLSWEGVVEETYAPILKKHRGEILPPDENAVKRLKSLEKGWTMEHDSRLVQLMSQNLFQEAENLGSLRGFVDSIGVSSYSVSDFSLWLYVCESWFLQCRFMRVLSFLCYSCLIIGLLYFCCFFFFFC